jgi:adenylate cyclase
MIFIGNGVMAIFSSDESEKSKSNSCLSALSEARLALSNAKKLQTANKTGGEANINFGIGLHVGEVILGNVGTKERLDMTVTGSAANQVMRLEALTKTLSLCVLASPQFFNAHQDGLISIGQYPVPDLGGMTEIYSLIGK